MTTTPDKRPTNQIAIECAADIAELLIYLDCIKIEVIYHTIHGGLNKVIDKLRTIKGTSTSTPMSIRIGKYTIYESSIVKTEGHLTIQHESGEGGDFNAVEFEKAIEKFYNDNF